MPRAWWVLLVVACGSAHGPVPATTGGAPPTAAEAAFDPPLPALRLPRHFTPTRYTARLAVDPAKPVIDGEIAIDGTLDRRTAMIWLHGKHLTISRAVAGDGTREVALAVTAQGEYLGLRPAQPLGEGAWTLRIAYRAELQTNGFSGAFVSRQGEVPYASTQFETTGARLVFPCLDEPDRKAPWQLTLDVPKDLVAVSNAAPSGTVALDAQHVRIAFAATRPIASYLVAFAVGPFDVVDGGKSKSGVPIHLYVPHGTRGKVGFLAEAEPRIVDILERWFGIAYPYGKLDLVAVPASQGGAMENAGMIVSDARSMLRDRPSPLDRYKLVSLFGHETAHQWFGDLVTAAWWDDIWLNESFATWIEDKVLIAFDPKWPSQASAHRAAAFDADALASARAIHQPVDTEAAIHTIFDGITYPKGASVLRMLEHELGEAAFQTAIRRYLAAHADANATSADVFAALAEAAGHPLDAFTRGYFDQAGAPEVAMDLTCDGGGRSVVTLAQRRFSVLGDPPDQVWPIPVCVAYEGPKGQRVATCTLLAKDSGELALDTCPNWFAPAGDDGYYHAKLATSAIEAVRDKGWASLAPPERIALAAETYTYATLGQQPLALVASLVDKLRADPDPLEQAAALGDPSFVGDGDATGLPSGLYLKVPPDLLPAVEQRIRTLAEPLAVRLGLVAKPADDFATALLRADAVSAARHGHSHVLDKEARRLAEHYRDLPLESRGTVILLAIAADAKLAERMLAELLAEPDPVVRGELIRGFGSLEDATRHRAFLDALLHAPSLTGEDLLDALVGYGEPMRGENEAFVRAHFADLKARLTSGENEDFPEVLGLVWVFTSACDPARRDELVGHLHTDFDAVPNSALFVKQAIESLDQCIAHRKVLEPALRLWLGGKSR